MTLNRSEIVEIADVAEGEEGAEKTTPLLKWTSVEIEEDKLTGHNGDEQTPGGDKA